MASLDDDPGVRPDAHAFIVDKALWFTVTDDRIPGQNAPPQFLTGRSHAIAVRAATLSVCWLFGEGTFAGKRGNGRDAPIPALRDNLDRPDRVGNCGHSGEMGIRSDNRHGCMALSEASGTRESPP